MMKALSVRQPWAWAIIYGGKDVENRSAISIRNGSMHCGRIMIHASKGMTRDEYDSAQLFMKSINIDCPKPDELVRGAVIGTVNVVDIVDTSTSDWFFGPCALVMRDIEPLSPVPGRGALGYFDWHASGDVEHPKQWMTRWRDYEDTIYSDMEE